MTAVRITLWMAIGFLVSMAGAAYLPGRWWQVSFASMAFFSGGVMSGALHLLCVRKCNEIKWLDGLVQVSAALVVSWLLVDLFDPPSIPPLDPLVKNPPPVFDWRKTAFFTAALAPALVALYGSVRSLTEELAGTVSWRSLVHSVVLLGALEAMTPFLNMHSLTPVWAWYWGIVSGAVLVWFFTVRRNNSG